MPPSISVTREQEVWGMEGIYTAHIHKYVFKIIHKRHFKARKKEVQVPPKSSLRGQLKPKNQSDAGSSRKKPILGGRVPRRARQKDPKMDLQTEPTPPKSKMYVRYKKNIICEVNLGPKLLAFGR